MPTVRDLAHHLTRLGNVIKSLTEDLAQITSFNVGWSCGYQGLCTSIVPVRIITMQTLHGVIHIYDDRFVGRARGPAAFKDIGEV